MKENLISYFPLKVYRYLCWLQNERKLYKCNKKYFTKKYADICFRAEKMKYTGKPREEVLSAYAKKDAYILNYLENLLRDIVDQYKKGKNNMQASATEQKKIWVFWWSGEKNAPEIVKACIKSIRKNSNGHEVIMLDRNNYNQYIILHKSIIAKHENGLITHTHFSDILRFGLLATYGGMWIDATVFLSKPIPKNIFGMKWYTLKSYDESAVYYSKSRWCSYFLEGDKEFPLFSFVLDCLTAYWERTDKPIIDYLLIDYVIGLAYKYIRTVQDSIDQLPDNNLLRGRLMREINDPYSKELFDSLSNGTTFASKLSWRYGKPRVKTFDGRLSNYGFLLLLNEEDKI